MIGMLQNNLNLILGKDLDIDGDWGTETLEAVQEFKNQYLLQNVQQENIKDFR